MDEKSVIADLTAAGFQIRSRRLIRLSGGFRHENFRIEMDGGPAVLRLYDNVETREKETRLASFLLGRVPTPGCRSLEIDLRVKGKPAALFEYIEGDLAETVLGRLEQDSTSEAGFAMGSGLVTIGRVCFPAAGFLSSDLKPTGERIESSATLLPYVEERLFGPVATEALGITARDRCWSWLVESAPLIDELPESRALVHADFNPKNVKLLQDSRGWRVAAILDWEFAFSGNTLWDIGNMLRFADRYHPCFEAAFVAGFQAAGGLLPDNWRHVARVLDAANLAEFVSRGPSSPFFAEARELLLRRYRPPDGTPTV